MKNILTRFVSLGVVSFIAYFIVGDIRNHLDGIYIESHNVRVVNSDLNEDGRKDSIVIDSNGYKTPFIKMEDGNLRSVYNEEIPAIYSKLEQIE